MNQITVGHTLTSQLEGLMEPVVVVDENGRALGHFLPSRNHSTGDSPYSIEELAAMHGEEGGRSLSEIWESLGAK